MAKIWEDDTVSEYDLISEEAQKAEELAEEYASMPTVVEAEESDLDEISEESAFELTHSESNVIYNARLRLEQAKLYEMLINHDLFEGVDASPEAIKNVQNELKFYIVKRLEILLGIREPVVRVAAAAVDLPFNDVEIDFLKQLAYKGTFGKSSEERVERPPAPRQVLRQVQKPNSLVKPKPAPAEKAKEQPRMQAPVAKRPEPPPAPKKTPTPPPQRQAPVKKAANTAVVGSSGMGRNLTPDEAMAIAKEDLKTVSKKPFHQMTAKEKAAKILEVNEKYARPAAKNAIPMPSPGELEMKYMTQQQNRGYSNNQADQFNVMLATALAAQKNNRGDIND